MLMTKTVIIRWHGNSRKHYESKGYICTKRGDEFEVKVEDLTDGANAKVKICCDICNKNTKEITYLYYIKRYKDEYICEECNSKNKICYVCSSNKNVKRNKETGKYLCEKHYMQMIRHGTISNRTRFDDNYYEIHDNYVELFLYDKDGNPTKSTLISLDKLDLVKQYKWHLGKGDRVKNINKNSERRTILIHRLIMGVLEEENDNVLVDHINGNTLDNRNENLRLCSMSENNRNRTVLSSKNTSGISGVDFNKKNQKWRARIGFSHKSIHLGLFENIEDAIVAREKAELKYFKEFSPRFEELRLKYKEYYEYLIENNLFEQEE